MKFSDLDKSLMKHIGLFNKSLFKKIPNIPIKTEQIVNFHFSHYKSMAINNCHSNQSSYLSGIKKKHTVLIKSMVPLVFMTGISKLK